MQRKGAGGFSLIELMVAIAIVAILLAVAFPNFEDSMRRNRLATTTNELLGSVALAMLCTAVAACWLPARHAARLDPAEVLRH